MLSNVFSLQSLRRALQFLLIPFLEYLALRLTVKYWVDLKVGWGIFGADFSAIMPPIFAALLIFSLMSEKQFVPLVLQRRSVRLNLGGLVLFLVTALLYKVIPSLSALWITLVAGAVFFTLASSLFLWVPPNYFFKHPLRHYFIPGAIIAFSGAITNIVFHRSWPEFLKYSSAIFCGMLGKTTAAASCEFFPGYTYLRYPGFVFSVGIGCSGAEGVTLFLMTLPLLYFIYPKRFSLAQWGLLTITGLLYVTLLNVARISLIYLMTAKAQTFWDTKTAMLLTRTFFHPGFGWALYIVGIPLFFRALAVPMARMQVAREEK